MDAWLQSLSEAVQSHWWVAFPACFLAGVISSASPCVLAMIPLVMGYVSGYSEGSQKKAIQYSLVFTLGLTITFTILGIMAGALGRLFGDVGQLLEVRPAAGGHNPGLVLLGVFKFNIAVPQRFLPKRRALLGAFLMGLFFGIVASPCATPVLAVILTLAATRDDWPTAAACCWPMPWGTGCWSWARAYQPALPRGCWRPGASPMSQTTRRRWPECS